MVDTILNESVMNELVFKVDHIYHLAAAVGVKNIIYVGTINKVNNVPYLLVDTGDQVVDKMLEGYRLVVVGYRMSQRKHVKAII